MKSTPKRIVVILTFAASLGLMRASSADAQDVVIVNSSPVYLQPQPTYQWVPSYQQPVVPVVDGAPYFWDRYSEARIGGRLSNVMSTSVMYATPIISTTRDGLFRVRKGTRRAASRATDFYLEWHPASWIAQDLGLLDADRVRRFVNGN